MAGNANKAVLMSLVNTFLPELGAGIPKYAERAASALQTILESAALTTAERQEFDLLVTLLSRGWGTSLLFMAPTVFTPFTQLQTAEREQLLLRLAGSRVGFQRKAFFALKRLVISVAITFIDDAGPNPVWEALRYPGNQNANSNAAAADAVGPLTVDFRQHRQPISAGQDGEALPVEVDVVIVGSGCGGGVSAAVLAEAGQSVLVIEKGPYVPPEAISGNELDTVGAMYEKAGLLTTADGSIGILAGACLGGGSTINWACCLAPPDAVRAEWADPEGEHRLPQFFGGGGTASEFDQSLDHVLVRIGASQEGVIHNRNNRALIAGCEGMGYDWRVAPQNLRDTGSVSAGWTCFGDARANKQGGLATFLADATKAGMDSGYC